MLPASLYAGSIKYKRGEESYIIIENKDTYEVRCQYNGTAPTSRTKALMERKHRLQAIDLIGSYIIFKSNPDIPEELFSVYVESIDLHYSANIDGLIHSVLDEKGKCVDCFICPKGSFNISNASYAKIQDVSSLVQRFYSREINEESAHLLILYDAQLNIPFISIERDYLTGKANISPSIRNLQNKIDRLEFSLISDIDSRILSEGDIPKEACSKTFPYTLFDYEEYLTAANYSDKDKYYKKWMGVLSSEESAWSKMLLFVAQKANRSGINSFCTITDVIEHFPGAVSPIGIRTPINNMLLEQAQTSYAESNFRQAEELLNESINSEGISAQSLNLIGATYRYLEEPGKAMAYLLLCLKLNPSTPYVVGNIILTLKDMSFKYIKEIANELKPYAEDKWSKDIISSIV